MPRFTRIALATALPVALMLAGCDRAPSGHDATPEATGSAEPSQDAAQVPETAPRSEVPIGAATPVAEAVMQPLSCTAEIGSAAASRLVSRCVAVSPATRPPCNAANSCAMIRNEIARSCAMIGVDAAKTPQCGGVDPVGREAAADMVERYYAAINARDYGSAWELWGDDGGTSGKTFAAFSEGFALTRRVHVTIGNVSDVEGGAGSLYVTVPVTLDAELTDGRHQRFAGKYALRQINRGMGISQGWHIATAQLRAM